MRSGRVNVFITVSSVVPFKGIHVLLEALKMTDSITLADSLFVIVGPEPEEYKVYKEYLLRLVEEYGLGNHVFFSGWQENVDIFYNSCDCLIHPSMSTGELEINGERMEISGNEGFPTCILEAMKYSVPVIASSISGIPEQIEHGLNGILVEPNNPPQLAKAIQQMADSPIEDRKRYGDNSHKIFKDKFTLASFTDSIKTVYSKHVRP
jgi:glycosyltransferase involved in cell wall biosynthesis